MCRSKLHQIYLEYADCSLNNDDIVININGIYRLEPEPEIWFLATVRTLAASHRILDRYWVCLNKDSKDIMVLRHYCVCATSPI